MPTVMAYHDVKDKDHWLASPKREEFFGPLGVTNIRTFVDPENPTRVGLVMGRAFVSTMAGPRVVVRRCGHSRDIPAHSRRRWVLFQPWARIGQGFVQLPTAGSGMNSRIS